MFKAISWGQFTGVVLLVLALYYVYIGLTYYRAELLGLVKGRGKTAGDEPAPARALSSLIGKGPLMAKPAPPTAPPEVPASTKAPDEGEENSEEEDETTEGENEPGATEENQELGDLPTLDLPTVEVSDDLNDGNTIESVSFDGNSINFDEQYDAETPQNITSGIETAPEEYDPSQTIGVAQLGNYFERAAEGQLTQDDMVEQAPALENTALLMAFYQASNKSAQRTTAHLFAEIEEPTLN